jgi:hypothetical protein
MERLTDKKVAENLKSNIEGLKKAGLDISIDDLRYIKLAEYENEEERKMQWDDMCRCANCWENIIFSTHESNRMEKQWNCCKRGVRMDGDVK